MNMLEINLKTPLLVAPVDAVITAIDFDKFTFSKKYWRDNRNAELELFFDFDLREVTVKNTKCFTDYQSILHFLLNNRDKKVHITRTQTPDFYQVEDLIVINLDNYQAYCKKIGQNGKNRTQAFLAQNVKHYSEDEKKKVLADSTDELILERINSFNDSEKATFVEKLKLMEGIELPVNTASISNEQFLEAFGKFINDPVKQSLVLSNYPQIQVKILEEYKEFLESSLDKAETFLQKWIDGKIDNDGNDLNVSDDERKRISQSRCLIFGLEFIGHKREGEVSSKRFDILTRVSQGKNDYVLIELKSPNSDVFDLSDRINANDGSSTEYSLSKDISRAIPQIAEYRDLLENGTQVEWQRIGLPKGRISKCIIVIGTKHEDNELWMSHYASLKKNLSSTIEIITYTDLISKLSITIKNLKENL